MNFVVRFFLLFCCAASLTHAQTEDVREIIVQHFGRDVATVGPFRKDKKEELDVLSSSDREAALTLLKHGAVGFLLFNREPSVANRIAFVDNGKVVGDFVIGAPKTKPFEVYFVGNQQKANDLFGKDPADYQFTVVHKTEISPPTTRYAAGIGRPAIMRTKNLKHFSAMIALIVDETGKVIAAAADKASDDEVTPPVLKQAASWVFHPAKFKGRAVGFLVFVPVEINVNSGQNSSEKNN